MTIAMTGIPQLETPSREELERIKAFRLPNYVPPYPYKRNRFADNVKAEANRWVEEYSLQQVYKTPKELQALYKADFAELAMVGYVDCGEKEAAWSAKFYIWLFIFDDRLDDITNFCSPEKSTTLFLELHVILMWLFPEDEHLYQKCLEFLDELGNDLAGRSEALNYVQLKLDEARQMPSTAYDASSPQVDPLCKAFADLWATLCETMPNDFLRRWALLFQDQLLGNFKEIGNRKSKTMPSVEYYCACRRGSGGMMTAAVIIEFLDKVHLPNEIFDRPQMHRLLLAAHDVCAWHNDLWSFQKEASKGDVHNLVIVVSHEEGCSYAEAGIRVYHMMLDKIVEMEKAIDDLEKVTPPEFQNAISRYSHWVRTFVTGSHHWHDNCVRYIKYE